MSKTQFQPPVIERYIEQRTIREGRLSRTVYSVVLCKDGKTYAFIEHVSVRTDGLIPSTQGFGWFCLDDKAQREAHDIVVLSDFLQDDWRAIAKMADDTRPVSE